MKFFKSFFTLIICFYFSYAFSAKNNEDKIKLKRAQWYEVDNELKFRVNKVLDDSRCPKGARCVWAGRVSIEIEFKNKEKGDKLAFGPTHGIGDTINLLSFPISQKDRKKNFLEGFIWKKRKILLIRVLPYPGEGGEEEFIFKISKKSNE